MAAVRYTLARLVLFAAALGLLYLLGARGVLLVVLALLVSGLISVIALSGQRDRMSAELAEQYQRLRRRAGERAKPPGDERRGGAGDVEDGVHGSGPERGHNGEPDGGQDGGHGRGASDDRPDDGTSPGR